MAGLTIRVISPAGPSRPEPPPSAPATAPHFPLIDRAKAIGIVLVVLGHAPGMPEPLVTLIYGFHMPLFFFLAGFLLSRRKLELGAGAHAAGVLRGLGLPYLGFFALSYGYWLATRNLGARAAKFAGIEWSDPLLGLVSGVGDQIVVNIALWFFPCLITTALVYHGARKFLGARAALGLFGLLGLADALWADRLPGRLPWGLDNAWAALAFYALGQWLRGMPRPPERWFGPPAAALALGGGCLLLTLALTQRSGRVDLNHADFGAEPWLYFPTALAGIAAVLALARVLPERGPWTWLARNSWLIFPTHPLAINFLSGLGKLVLGLPEAYFTSPGFGLLASALAIAVCAPVARFWPGASGGNQHRPARPLPAAPESVADHG